MASLLSYALCSLDDVKESLGVASSDTSYDNLIRRKINQATRAIENYCGRRFKLTTYTDEVYDALGTDQILLKQRPVVGSVTLKSRDTSLNEDDFDTVDSELQFLDANSGVLRLDFNTYGRWGRYAVTYQAGYDTIPEDIAEACATLAAYWVLNADASTLGVSSKREGQRSVNYDNTRLSFTDLLKQLGIDMIVNSYANYPLGGL